MSGEEPTDSDIPESSAQYLLDGAFQVFGQGLLRSTQGSRNIHNLIKGNGFGMFYVLFLFPIPWWLFQGTDDKRRGGGHYRNGRPLNS